MPAKPAKGSGMTNPCWAGYKMIGTKTKGGKSVPNCVPSSSSRGKSKGKH